MTEPANQKWAWACLGRNCASMPQKPFPTALAAQKAGTAHAQRRHGPNARAVVGTVATGPRGGAWRWADDVPNGPRKGSLACHGGHTPADPDALRACVQGELRDRFTLLRSELYPLVSSPERPRDQVRQARQDAKDLSGWATLNSQDRRLPLRLRSAIAGFLCETLVLEAFLEELATQDLAPTAVPITRAAMPTLLLEHGEIVHLTRTGHDNGQLNLSGRTQNGDRVDVILHDGDPSRET
jgi:hypothetical protein